MDKTKTKRQSFLWVLIVWSVSIVLSVLAFLCEIHLPPTNILGTTSVDALIWFPALFILGRYIVVGLIEKKRSILLVPLIIVLGACLFEVLSVFAFSEAPSCYSVSQEGITVKYQCVCRWTYIESAYEYDYDNCQFSRLIFLPLAQKLPSALRRTGVVTPNSGNQADFLEQDPSGKQFDVEYPSRLIIKKNKDNVQIGFINFQFIKDTNTFEVSFVADLVCSKYYTTPISIKNAEDILIKLCAKEYKFKFTNNNGNIIVTQE